MKGKLILINKLAEFKKCPHLSRINTNLLQSVNPIVKVPKDERSITRYFYFIYLHTYLSLAIQLYSCPFYFIQ